MKISWLKREDNKRLMLLFGGWSTGEAFYSGIDVPGWDVLLGSAFDDYNFPRELLAGYDTVYLYAWSLGVHAAAWSLRSGDITCAFAINGTERPVDDNLGIPASIFRGTREGLSPRSLLKFQRRMAGDAEMWEKMQPLLEAEPDIERLKTELQLVEDNPKPPHLEWRRVYLGEKDRIFPYANMERAWKEHPSQPEICSYHAMGHYMPLRSIVRNTAANLDRVARNFRESLETYDANAGVQSRIASELARKAGENLTSAPRTVLEIGQGTGLYTRRYAPLTSPDAALDLIDLYETPVPEVERKMVFHTGDAEKWLHDAPAFRRWDFITSASAIQWFSNMRGFLADCARHLENGGLVAFSSFAPGNLSEFDTLRPSPMLYATPDDIRRWASECFHDVEVTVDEITVAFPTARDALLHLRLTGVGGFSSHRFPLSKLLAAVPQNGEGLYTLTYRPLYLIARK